jgi:sulfur-oxidizing protein SoxZ
MTRTLITIPSNITRGEIIDIRVLIQHPMETGYRRGSEGAMLARNLIRKFNCEFVDLDKKRSFIFNANLHAAIAANPYVSFSFRAESPGTLFFNWVGDNGFTHTETRPLLLR